MRLLTRLLLQVVAPFLIGAVLVLLIIGQQLEKKLREEILETAGFTINLRTTGIEHQLAANRRILRLLARSEITAQKDLEHTLKLLPQWQRSLPEAESLLLFTLDGKAYRSPSQNFDVSDRPYLEQIRRGEPITTSALVSRVSGHPAILLTEPITDAQGNILGALGITLTIERIASWVREIKTKTGGIAILVDQQGQLLVGHPDEPTQTGMLSDPIKFPLTTSILNALQTSQNGNTTNKQAEWQVFQRQVSNSGWRFILAFPEKSLFRLVYKTWEIGIWIIIAFTLVSVIAVFLFNRSLLRPIRSLSQAQQKLEQGDLHTRINSDRLDELGQLSDSFDHMAARLDSALQNAHESEKKFRLLFENANDAIFLLDGNRFIDANPYTLELFECSRTELLESGPLDFSPPQQADGRNTKEAGQAYIEAALAGQPQTFAWQHTSLKGRLIVTEVNLKRIEINGRILLQAIVRDFTERERAEAQARVFETKFQRVFAASVDYMIIARLHDGMIIEANEEFGRLTGYPPEMAIGKTTVDLNLWDNPDQRNDLIKQLETYGQVKEYPMFLRRCDGQRREVSLSVAIFDLNTEPHYVSIARDMTDEKALQRALQASEVRLKTIIEATPSPICINRLSDRTFLSVNPAWEALYGVAAEQAIGKTITQCNFTIENPQTLAQQTQQLLTHGSVDNAEAAFITPQGHRVSIIYSSRVIELDGEPVMISINTDISRLKETEKRLKTMVEAAPAIIVITRLADFTYLEVNPEFERLFGRNNEQVQGKNIYQAGFGIVDPPALRDQTLHLLAAGRIDNAHTDLINADGQQISLIYSSRITELAGESVMLSIGTDITHLKEVEAGLRAAESALKESEQRFIALFQSSPVALSVSIKASDGYLLNALNAAWYRSFGYAADEAIGLSALALGLWKRPEDRAELHARIEQDHEIQDYEAWLKRKDGTSILCNISGKRIVVGEQTLLLAAYVDITEKRRSEQEIRELNTSLETRILQRTQELQQAQSNLMRSEKLASLGSLVAGVAHELNTPIGTSLTVASTLSERTSEINEIMISGMRRSALENYLSDTQAGTAILLRNLQRAAELIQSFKSIAVDQSNDQRRDFELHQIIDETLVALRPSLKQKPFIVKNAVEPGVHMNSYAGSLEQVVVNLVNNAILHAFEGRETGTITIEGRALGDKHIELVVHDNGCGVTAENIARIFDPFFTTKLGKGGSGLGLHIVRNIVEDILGGHIEASSEIDQGTTMTIHLPCQARDLKTTTTNGATEGA